MVPLDAEVAHNLGVPTPLMHLYFTIRRPNVDYDFYDWAPFLDKTYSSMWKVSGLGF